MDKLDYYKIEDYAKTHMTDITHDMHHVYRVLNVALDIAEHEANVDMDVLTAACLLHDIGRNAQAADPKLCHAEVGGEMAHDFLLTLGWTKEKAFCVKKCVQSHRFRGDNKPQSIEAKILFDADKVDVCGVIGIARGFTYIGENNSGVIYKTDESGAVLTDEPETFFGEYNYKLRNIYDKFYTQRGKEIAGMRWKNSLDFYDALLSEVKQSTNQKDILLEIRAQVAQIFNEVIIASKLEKGNIIVLGCSTSEILGGQIGKNGSEEVGKAVIEAAMDTCKKYDVFLAMQSCEHLNRALVVERDCAKAYDLPLVSVLPTPSAGGSCAAAAFNSFKDAVIIEHITANAGIDIGDTHIGMHVKFVQVPYRLATKKVGNAHVTALTSRPKLIGGARAVY